MGGRRTSASTNAWRATCACTASTTHSGCAVVRETSWLHEFLRDPAALAAGRASQFVHPDHGAASTIGRIVQLRSAAPLEPVQAPRLGQHTREILAELGFSTEQIGELIDHAVVRADRTGDVPLEVDR
jgi:crotonobetainyl-CoA:carnitine CoA-transferase CaiB-like acyl-CoA transferase